MRSSVSLVLMGTQPVALLCVVETCLRPGPEALPPKPASEIGFVRAAVRRLFRHHR
jgi:hypothetical protein